MFKNLFKFPLITQLKASTLCNDIQPIVPSDDPIKYVDTYTDHWGQTVSVTEHGTRIITSNVNTEQYGDHGIVSGMVIILSMKN